MVADVVVSWDEKLVAGWGEDAAEATKLGRVSEGDRA
jgi:hypothetical protein